MSILQRLSSHQVMIDFHVKVHKFTDIFNAKALVKVVWKRRKKNVETKIVERVDEVTQFEEILTMVNTVYSKTSGYLEKIAEIRVVEVCKVGVREMGKVVINLSEFIGKQADCIDFNLKGSSSGTLNMSISTHISSLSVKPSKVDTIESLTIQLFDSQQKLRQLKENYGFLCDEKEKINSELDQIKSELIKIQNIEMTSSESALKEEKIFLEKVFQELSLELEELNTQEQTMKDLSHRFSQDLTSLESIDSNPQNFSHDIDKILDKFFP